MAKSTPLQQDKVYVDFPTNLDFHPIKKDLSLLTNEDAVKRSIRNIVLTNYYERNNPTVGANISAQLFELSTPQTQIIIEDSLRSAIQNHEPRAKLISLRVTVQQESHEISATIVFSVINTVEPVTMTVLLTRIR